MKLALFLVISSAFILLCSTPTASKLVQGRNPCYNIHKHLQPVITQPAVTVPYELVVGESLQISCHVNKTKDMGYPRHHPIFMWWCNTTDLACFKNEPMYCNLCINVTESAYEADWFGTILTINHATYSDADTYSCLAFTDDDDYNCKPGNDSIRITVKDKFGPRLTVQPSRNLTTTVGRTVELVCVDEGYPTPTVTWYKGGDLIHAGRLLQLRNVSEGHAGLYRCCTANRLDQKYSSTVFLQVKEEKHYTVHNIIAVPFGCLLGLLGGLLLSIDWKRKEETLVTRRSESIQTCAEDEQRLIDSE